jgi:hypothetical protein
MSIIIDFTPYSIPSRMLRAISFSSEAWRVAYEAMLYTRIGLENCELRAHREISKVIASRYRSTVASIHSRLITLSRSKHHDSCLRADPQVPYKAPSESSDFAETSPGSCHENVLTAHGRRWLCLNLTLPAYPSLPRLLVDDCFS